MFRLLHTTVIALLVSSLVCGPAQAAAARSLGNVLFAQNARLGGVAAAVGATVFAGDRISTETGGSIRVRIGTGQLYMPASSTITLEEYPAGVSATLTKGTVGFGAQEEALIVVKASEALIRPKTSQPTHGQVELVGPKELLVSSYRGALEVVVGTEVNTVPEATSYRVMLETEPQDPQGTGATTAKRNRAVLIFVGAAIAAAAITFVVLQNLSPEKP